jgi:hypothetical protein
MLSRKHRNGGKNIAEPAAGNKQKVRPRGGRPASSARGELSFQPARRLV